MLRLMIFIKRLWLKKHLQIKQDNELFKNVHHHRANIWIYPETFPFLSSFRLKTQTCSTLSNIMFIQMHRFKEVNCNSSDSPTLSTRSSQVINNNIGSNFNVLDARDKYSFCGECLSQWPCLLLTLTHKFSLPVSVVSEQLSLKREHERKIW